MDFIEDRRIHIGKLSSKDLCVHDPVSTLFLNDVYLFSADIKFAPVVRDFVTRSEHNQRIKERLSNPGGYFLEDEALEVIQIMICEACERYDVNRVTMPEELTQADEVLQNHFEVVLGQYYNFWNNGEMASTWAMGVLLYILLTGPPVATANNQEYILFYNALAIGPPLNQTGQKRQCWSQLTDDTRTFVLRLLHMRSESFDFGFPGLNESLNDDVMMRIAFKSEIPFCSEEDTEQKTIREKSVIPFCEDAAKKSDGNNKNNRGVAVSASKVTVRSYVRNKPKVGKAKCTYHRKSVASKAKGMDVASFKTALQLHNEEMQELQEQRALTPNHKSQESKQEWAAFFHSATKLSKKKKRKMNAAKNQKKKEERERKQKEWEERNTPKYTYLDMCMYADINEIDRRNKECHEVHISAWKEY